MPIPARTAIVFDHTGENTGRRRPIIGRTNISSTDRRKDGTDAGLVEF